MRLRVLLTGSPAEAGRPCQPGSRPSADEGRSGRLRLGHTAALGEARPVPLHSARGRSVGGGPAAELVGFLGTFRPRLSSGGTLTSVLLGCSEPTEQGRLELPLPLPRTHAVSVGHRGSGQWQLGLVRGGVAFFPHPHPHYFGVHRWAFLEGPIEHLETPRKGAVVGLPRKGLGKEETSIWTRRLSPRRNQLRGRPGARGGCSGACTERPASPHPAQQGRGTPCPGDTQPHQPTRRYP